MLKFWHTRVFVNSNHDYILYCYVVPFLSNWDTLQCTSNEKASCDIELIFKNLMKIYNFKLKEEKQ